MAFRGFVLSYSALWWLLDCSEFPTSLDPMAEIRQSLPILTGGMMAVYIVMSHLRDKYAYISFSGTQYQ